MFNCGVPLFNLKGRRLSRCALQVSVSKHLIVCYYTFILNIPSFSSLTESYLVCYECTVHPPSSHSNQTARLCSKFDASAHFQVECPYSTFCMRRSFKLDLKDGKTVNAVERGCASQKYQYQSFYDGKWHAEEAVEDKVYRPGCYPAEQLGLKTPTTEYCYCPTNLCNSAKSTQEYGTGFQHTDTMAVIIVFNAVKYIRSLR